MDAEGISYKNLRRIQQSERQSPSLSHIDPQFYKDVTIYINGLRQRLDEEKHAQKKMLLHEELQNIEKIARNIYEQREKKIILAAISKARGGHPSTQNMIKDEQRFFDSILDLILSTRSSLLDSQANDNINSEPIQTEKHIDTKKQDISSLTDKNKTQSNKTVSPPQHLPHPIIRVITDIPTFIGTDKQTYHLKKGDVLSIASDMAEMLIKRKKAHLINYSSLEDKNKKE